MNQLLEKITLGTYTRRESKGIYEIYLNTETKELQNLSLRIDEQNPTYLDTLDNRFLYSVTQQGSEGGVASYKINEDQSLTFINRVTEAGAPPCYVAVDTKRQLVFAANYHQGILYVYKISADGSIKQTDKIQHQNAGPHENQDGPHAHYLDLTPDNRVVACNLGNDTVYTYDVSNDGQLTQVAEFKTAPGAGPRHIAFHPNLTTAYLFAELSSEIIVLNYAKETGTFTAIQSIKTIPATHTEFNSGAAIRVSKDGRFVYASNRGHNSIISYTVSEEDQTLTQLQQLSVEGDFPRDFNLNPEETFVVVANQNSDNLTLFSRDTISGLLTLQQKDVYAPEVVCVKFNIK